MLLNVLNAACIYMTFVVLKLVGKMQGLREMLSGRSLIGIKRMGELDGKPFQTECKKRFESDLAEVKCVELISKWEADLGDPSWYPCKVVFVDGKEQV